MSSRAPAFPASFATVFGLALEGHPCEVVGLWDTPRVIPVASWLGEADGADHSLLDHCRGAVLDIGCGPGRLTAALQRRGVEALGIDLVAEAVTRTRVRGGRALRRSVFDELPGEGCWDTALLADGNIGIGGDPARLLRRARDVVRSHGSLVVELEPPGVALHVAEAHLRSGGRRSPAFPWAVVGVDDLWALADAAALDVVGTHALAADRWCAVLTPRRAAA